MWLLTYIVGMYVKQNSPWLLYAYNRQVLPTDPSPTITIFFTTISGADMFHCTRTALPTPNCISNRKKQQKIWFNSGDTCSLYDIFNSSVARDKLKTKVNKNQFEWPEHCTLFDAIVSHRSNHTNINLTCEMQPLSFSYDKTSWAFPAKFMQISVGFNLI